MEGDEIQTVFFLFLTAFFYGAAVGSSLDSMTADLLLDRKELREFAGGLAGLVVAFILSCILSKLRLWRALVAIPQQPADAWLPVQPFPLQQQEVDRKGDHDEV